MSYTIIVELKDNNSNLPVFSWKIKLLILKSKGKNSMLLLVNKPNQFEVIDGIKILLSNLDSEFKGIILLIKKLVLQKLLVVHK